MIFIIAFATLTTIVLLLGLLSMAAGEKFSKKYGTKLMSLRIAMQSIAILSLVWAYFLWSNWFIASFELLISTKIVDNYVSNMFKHNNFSLETQALLNLTKKWAHPWNPHEAYKTQT